MKFEEIAVFENCTKDEYSPDDLYWFSIRDEKYNGFFDTSILEKFSIKTDALELDLQNYTYIVVINYELDSLKYSASKTKNRIMGIFPKQYVGIVTLKNFDEDTIRIYKTKRIDIDCDYHQRDANVTIMTTS